MYLRQQQPGMTLQTSYIDMKYVYVYMYFLLRTRFFMEVKFMLHKINYFKVNDSVTFHSFTMLFNHYLSLVAKHFHHPKIKLHTH